MMNADQDGAVPRLVPAPPLPRLTAFALDAVTYLIIPALLLPLGLLLIRHGVILSSVAINAIGLVLVIAPATAWASWREARPRGATPGKRLLRLGVLDETTEALVPASKSLARNMIRIALPWELGHTVALGYAYTESSNVPVWLWLLTAIIYGWLIINLILLIMSRKPLHDRLAGTIVVRDHELITDYGCCQDRSASTNESLTTPSRHLQSEA